MAGASSFLVSFAKTLPFMLLCGIVGPIFLALAAAPAPCNARLSHLVTPLQRGG
jgi:hypothetical protein